MATSAQVNRRRRRSPGAWLALIIGLPALVAAGLFALLAQPAPGVESASTDGLRVLRSDLNGVVLELTVSSYQLSRRTVDGATYDVLSAPGLEAKGAVPGAPQLPMRGLSVAVPQGAQVEARVLDAQSEEIPGTLHLLPEPTEQIDTGSGNPFNYQNLGRRYVPAAALYARSAFEPQARVTLGTDGFMRSQRFVQVSLYPFAYNALLQKVRWSRRLTIELHFTYPHGPDAQAIGAAHDEGAYEKVLRANIVNYDSARNWRAPARGASSTPAPARPSAPASGAETYKIAVNQDGVYRLTYAALTGAGLSSFDASKFQIFKNGVELPISVTTNGTFSLGDYIEFYAQGMNTVYTDTNVYWLTAGVQAGLRMPTRSVAPAGGAAPTSFRDRAHIEENHDFIGNRPLENDADHWYWDIVYACGCSTTNQFFDKSPMSYIFTLRDFDPAATATLRANVFGWGPNLGDPTPHWDQIYVNGQLVTDDSWSGVVTHQSESAFPSSYLVSGTNTLSFTVNFTAGASFDEMFVNWFEVDYAHQYVARNDYAAFKSDVTGTVQLALTNFSSGNLALYDVTHPTGTVRLTGFSVTGGGGAYTLGLSDNLLTPTQYVAFAAPLSPLSITRYAPLTDLRSASNGADEIIIAADDFYTATAPLAAFRTSQGLRVVRARISDIYDQFSDGVFDATAIRAFLGYAYQNWQAPAPLYVVLVGDGWMNYRNYEPSSADPPKPDFIPPLLDAVDPFINITATDNRYVTIVGNDTVPDMAIGRLPVRSAGETTSVINKIIGYEQNPGASDWRRQIDFYTDNPDIAGDFYYVADDIINTTIPQTYSVTRVYYDPNALPGDPVHINDGALDTYLITSTLSAGALFANYVGHADPWQWAASPTLFGKDGALQQDMSPFNVFDSVQNGARTPIVLELTCRTGYFHLGDPDSLGPHFLTVPGRGAVADWASTGLGVNDGHDQLARGFYSAVFTDAVPTIGLATNESKNSLVSTGQFLELVDEFTLFGDPAMRMQSVPFADPAISKIGFASNGLRAGSAITFTLTFSNAGGAPAAGVLVTDVLASGLLSPSFTSSGASVVPVGSALYVWSVGHLAPGAGGMITVTATADSSFVNSGAQVLTNTATIGGASPDVNPANNSASAFIYQAADLMLSKSAQSSNGLWPGSVLTFTLNYLNRGGSTATGVVITDILPSGLLSSSFTSSGASVAPSGASTFVWNVADLPPNQGGVIIIKATADRSFVLSGTTMLTNTAVIRGAAPEVDLNNNSASAIILSGFRHLYLPFVPR